MPNFDEFKSKKKTFRAWDKDILTQLKIEKPFKKEEIPSEIEQKSDENVENKPTSNLQQTYIKPTSNLHQEPTSKLHQEIETYIKPTSQPTSQLTSNLHQTYIKPTSNLSFSSLVGLQRNILLTVFSSSKASRSKITEPLTLEFISNEVETTNGSTKIALQRLEKKGFIKTEEYKNGRGGWCKYSIPDFLYQELINSETYIKPTSNLHQTYSKLTAKPTSQPTSTPLSNNNNININTIITTDDDLPKEWGEINYDVLIDLGFSKTQLKQLYEINLKNPDKNLIKPEIVQLSIYHLAFGLKYTEKTKAIPNPLYVFMGVLRKGQAWIEDGYESEQIITMRAIVEQKKKEQTTLNSLQQEWFDIEYKAWFNGISIEDLKKILPNADFSYGKQGIGLAAKSYFTTFLWEEIKTSTQNPPSNATKTHQRTA